MWLGVLFALLLSAFMAFEIYGLIKDIKKSRARKKDEEREEEKQ